MRRIRMTRVCCESARGTWGRSGCAEEGFGDIGDGGCGCAGHGSAGRLAGQAAPEARVTWPGDGARQGGVGWGRRRSRKGARRGFPCAARHAMPSGARLTPTARPHHDEADVEGQDGRQVDNVEREPAVQYSTVQDGSTLRYGSVWYGGRSDTLSDWQCSASGEKRGDTHTAWRCLALSEDLSSQRSAAGGALQAWQCAAGVAWVRVMFTLPGAAA